MQHVAPTLPDFFLFRFKTAPGVADVPLASTNACNSCSPQEHSGNPRQWCTINNPLLTGRQAGDCTSTSHLVVKLRVVEHFQVQVTLCRIRATAAASTKNIHGTLLRTSPL